METIKRYVAFDGTPFEDRFACAQHDFTVKPELLDRLRETTRDAHLSTLRNWCGGDPDTRSYSSACACLGCANHFFYDLGLQYEHWKYWLEELRGEQPNDDIPDTHTDVDVILTNVGTNRIEAFKAIRRVTGLGIVETKKLMETPNAAIRSDIDFYTGKDIVDALEDAGATAKMVTAKNQRWTRTYHA